MLELTEDALLGGRVRLLQPARGHRAGTDAVLLAAALDARPGQTLIDVGAATGAVGLMIASRTENIGLVFVERDQELAEVCRRNCALIGVEAEVAVADILSPASRKAAGLVPDMADWVVTNPPFLEEGRSRASPESGRAAAHMLPEGGLQAWLRACAALLKPRGRLVVVHRADCLAECLSIKGMGGWRLRFVHPRSDQPAARLLVSAVKGSRAPLTVLPPLVLHDAGGGFTPEAEAIHRGETLIA